MRKKSIHDPRFQWGKVYCDTNIKETLSSAHNHDEDSDK